MRGLLHGPSRAWARAGEAMRFWRARRHADLDRRVRLLPGGRVINQQEVQSAIRVSGFTWIEGELLVFAHAGRIEIDEYCYVGLGARIWSAAGVTIGSRVFLAHGVNVHDNDAHATSAAERHLHFRELATIGRASFVEHASARQVRIEDDVWVGFNATVLKGVTLGRGAIVGAGSVVTHDVAPYSIVAGNPAVVVGSALP